MFLVSVPAVGVIFLLPTLCIPKIDKIYSACCLTYSISLFVLCKPEELYSWCLH